MFLTNLKCKWYLLKELFNFDREKDYKQFWEIF